MPADLELSLKMISKNILTNESVNNERTFSTWNLEQKKTEGQTINKWRS